MNRAACTVLTLALLLALLAPVSAEDPPIQTGEKEQVEVISIQVPVYVTRKGEPVKDLTIDNFLVTDNGSKQALLGLDIQDLTLVGPDEHEKALPLPAAARRNFLLLFDLTYSSPASLVRARLAAGEILQDALHQDDLVAVAVYGAGSGARVVLNFTSDREQLELAIASVFSPVDQGGFVDPLGMTMIAPNQVSPALTIVREAEGVSQGGGGQAGVPSEEDIQQHFELLERMAKNNEATGLRHMVVNLANDLGLLAKLLDSVVGRKHVLYLSEGFSDDLMLATQDRDEIARMGRARESGQIWEVNSTTRFGDSNVQASLYSMLEEFQRSDCVIHSINIANSSEKRGDGGNQGLFMMASETGGTYTENINDLSEAMGDIFKLTSVTYVLSYQPRDLKLDGKYHKLKVKLKDAPKGSKLHHRPGYFAPLPFGRQSRKQQQVSLANRIMAEVEGGSIKTSAAAFPFVGDTGQGFVPFLLEIDGASLTRGFYEPAIPVQLFVYALDKRGRIHDLLSQTVGVNIKQAGEPFKTNGLKYYGSMNLDPGEYNLRALILNPKTGASTLKIIPVSVPETDSDTVQLLPPMLPDPFGTWLLARQNQKEGEQPAPFPFMAGDRPYLPSTAPSFQADNPQQMVLMGRFEIMEDIALKWTILDVNGKPLRETALTGATKVTSAMNGYQVLTAEFDPVGLAPGSYRLTWTVNSSDGILEDSPAIPFTVR